MSAEMVMGDVLLIIPMYFVLRFFGEFIYLCRAKKQGENSER